MTIPTSKYGAGRCLLRVAAIWARLGTHRFVPDDFSRSATVRFMRDPPPRYRPPFWKN
jgi:hypothetical protein